MYAHKNCSIHVNSSYKSVCKITIYIFIFLQKLNAAFRDEHTHQGNYYMGLTASHLLFPANRTVN